ncbi:hypothetical protein [Halioxenophilus sp. WMMB6]|uniref:hypothetical protein n=1 Tax=Halioxenophilus sp. WMMB6 TaxID=3073815 RepID=UPI00295E5259|nr:hypothetical protein [Halioxenophilus sp. WMMB6]
MRKLFSCTLLIVLSLSLNGCLLTRVNQTKDDLCDKSIYFEPAQSLIKISRPILYDSDIIALVGEEPQRISMEAGTKYFAYEAKKQNGSGDKDLAWRFAFIADTEGDFKLSAIEVDKKIIGVLSPQLIEEVMASGCDAKINKLLMTLSVDFSGVDLSSIPAFPEIESVLGAAMSHQGDNYHYEYLSDNNQPALIELKVVDDRLQTIDVEYWRYRFNIDLLAGQATSKIIGTKNRVDLMRYSLGK